MRPRIALAGGGTAGHLFPCLAVGQQLLALAPEAELLFLGSRVGVDARLLEEHGLRHVLLGARPFPYRPSLAMLRSGGALVVSTVAAYRALRHFRPQALFASGGYISAPAVLAARLLGKPCVIHAPDALPDRTSRALARYAAKVTLSFEAAAEYFPGRPTLFTGAPLRQEIFGYSRGQGLTQFGLDPARRTLLVTGGSQGAQRLNQAVLAALPELAAWGRLQVVHLTGERAYAQVAAQASSLGAAAPAYQCLPFFEEMGLAYAAADLILCRGGSSSLGEGLALGKPMIVVPYPHAAAHQKANARPLAEAGAAVVIEDEQLDGARLRAELEGLLDDSDRLAAMTVAARQLGRPQAAAEIARLLLELAGGAAG